MLFLKPGHESDTHCLYWFIHYIASRVQGKKTVSVKKLSKDKKYLRSFLLAYDFIPFKLNLHLLARRQTGNRCN